MATHSSILAWRVTWTEEPGDCSPWGHTESMRLKQLSSIHIQTFTFTVFSIMVHHRILSIVPCSI